MQHVVKLYLRNVELKFVSRLVSVPLSDEMWKTVRQLVSIDHYFSDEHVAGNTDGVYVPNISPFKPVHHKALDIKLKIQPLILKYTLAGHFNMEPILDQIIQLIRVRIQPIEGDPSFLSLIACEKYVQIKALNVGDFALQNQKRVVEA
jgi:hypothetical protein